MGDARFYAAFDEGEGQVIGDDADPDRMIEPCKLNWGAGRYGQAVKPEESVSVRLDWPQDSFTLALWIKLDEPWGSDDDFRRDILSGSRPHLTRGRDSPAITLHINVDGEEYDDVSTKTTSFESDRWYHLAYIFDGTTFGVYVDGRLENEVRHPGRHGRDGDIRLGPVAWLDDLRIYPRALSADEVADLAGK
jgi:hypothetical protein